MAQILIEAELGTFEHRRDLLPDTAKIAKALKSLQHSLKNTLMSSKLLPVVNTLASCLEKYLDEPISAVSPPKGVKGVH